MMSMVTENEWFILWLGLIGAVMFGVIAGIVAGFKAWRK